MLTLQGCCGAESMAHAEGLSAWLAEGVNHPLLVLQGTRRGAPRSKQMLKPSAGSFTYALLRLRSKLRRLDHGLCWWCLQNGATTLLMLQGKLGRMQNFLDKLHKGEQTSVSFLGASVSTAYCLHETIG